MSILKEIIESKKNELDLQKSKTSYFDLEKLRYFNRPTNSLKNNLTEDSFGIITEFKRKSPSKPKINLNAKVNPIVKSYAAAGSSGISILTNKKYFGGDINDLINARELTTLPILRKEFIIDEFQVVESKAIGADAILLIAACLSKRSIETLSKCAKRLGLDVLVEIHDKEELNKCLLETVDIIGVNNRNLNNFMVDINLSKVLSKFIPKEFAKISESGISNFEEILQLKDYGYNGFLIGDKFMSKSNPGDELSNMMLQLKKYAT